MTPRFSWQVFFLVHLLSFSILHLTRGLNQGNIIDGNPVRDERAILKFFCDKNLSKHLADGQISKLSTVIWLRQYLEQTNLKSKWVACRDRHLGTLIELHEIITKYNGDVCSEPKIRLVERFHYKYISTRQRHKLTALHDPVKMFFMMYSMDLSHHCQVQLLVNVEELKHNPASQNLTLNQGDRSIDNFVEGVHKYLGSPSTMDSYDDFLLLWNPIDDYRRRKQRDEPTSDESTGERVGLAVKVNSTGSFGRLQSRCRQELRPIYGEMLLPLMRLIDLGYYRPWSDKMAHLSRQATYGFWYSAMQVCESLLPIRFFEDPQLPAGEFLLLGKEEAAELTSKQPLESPRPMGAPSLSRQTLGGANYKNEDYQLRSVRIEKPRKLVLLVRRNLRARGRGSRRMVRQLAADLRGRFKPLVRRFFVSKLRGRGQEREQASRLIESSLAKTESYLAESDSRSVAKSLARKKRCASLVIVVAVIAIVAFIVILILLLI